MASKSCRMKQKTKAKKEALPPTPTQRQFEALNNAYQYFNQALFGGQLPGCILNFSRKKGTHGFMAPNRWRQIDEEAYSTHEISLTPYTLYREPILVFSTLVHEQVHLWQFEFGNPTRNGYHNKEWAIKMEEFGLMPSDTGQVGGKKTGQYMTHYIIEGGLYEQAFNAMPDDFKLPFTSLEGDLMKSLVNGTEGGSGTHGSTTVVLPPQPKSREKTKYSCPSCGVNVWGKPSLNLMCGDCNESLQAVEK